MRGVWPPCVLTTPHSHHLLSCSYFPQPGHTATVVPGQAWATRSCSSKPARPLRLEINSRTHRGLESARSTAIRKPLREGSKRGSGGVRSQYSDWIRPQTCAAHRGRSREGQNTVDTGHSEKGRQPSLITLQKSPGSSV